MCEEGHIRELVHDFRVYYHCSYYDCPNDEALLLIQTLPKGSMYLSSLNPRFAWSDEKNDIADLKDLMLFIVWYFCLDRKKVKKPQAVERPWETAGKKAKKKKIRNTKQKLNTIKWEKVQD